MLTKEITNEREYRIARAEAERLEEFLAKQDQETENLDPRLRQALHGATESRLDELRARIGWYENLKRSGGAVLELESLEDLPSLLVQARIASNLTQRELAERLGVSEQQVQKDEKTGYTKASLERLIGVARALDLPVRLTAILPSSWAAAAARSGHEGAAPEAGPRQSRVSARERQRPRRRR